MSNYYTYVNRVGNKIFHRYIENGHRKSEVVTDFELELFYETPNAPDSYSIDNKPLRRVAFNTISDMRQFIADNSSIIKIYGNTSPVHQFINKKYPGNLIADNSYEIFNFDIEVKHGDGYVPYDDLHKVKIKNIDNSKISEHYLIDVQKKIDHSLNQVWDEEKSLWMHFDFSCYSLQNIGFPDPDKAEEEILSISCETFKNSMNYCFGCDYVKYDIDPTVTYIHCENEKDLLLKFQQFWTEIYPEFITGWNVHFDICYLINRCNKILGEKITKRFSPFWNETTSIFEKVEINDNDNSYRILGCSIWDYLDLYKKYSLNKHETYRLDYIGEFEIGENKTDYSEFGSLMDLFAGRVRSNINDIPYEKLTEVQKFEIIKRKIKEKIDAIRTTGAIC